MNNDKIEIFTKKLNSLKVKQAMFSSSGFEVPKHISDEIKLIESSLRKLDKK
jgi:hypothetical protein